MRTTLKECIDYFNSNELMKSNAIRNMEMLGEWRTAEIYWNKIGKTIDANACKMIYEAIEKGDSFRDRTKVLYDWVNETVENGIMTLNEALKI